MYWAFLLVSCLINIYGIRLFALIEKATLTLHIGLWLVIIIVLCVVTKDKSPAEFVFTYSVNETGWSSNGIAWCIGMLTRA